MPKKRKDYSPARIYAHCVCGQLRARRKATGQTQAAIARKMRISQSDFSRFESGVEEPRLSMFFRWCEALKVVPTEVTANAYLRLIQARMEALLPAAATAA